LEGQRVVCAGAGKTEPVRSSGLNRRRRAVSFQRAKRRTKSRATGRWRARVRIRSRCQLKRAAFRTAF
jgi:hypothetical protein